MFKTAAVTIRSPYTEDCAAQPSYAYGSYFTALRIVTTEAGLPTVDEVLSYGRSSLAYKVALDLSIHESLKARVVKSFGHWQIFLPRLLRCCRLRVAVADRGGFYLQMGVGAPAGFWWSPEGPRDILYLSG